MKTKTGSHFLYPSTLFTSQEEFEIQTLLGSCVAVCLHDPTRKIGGMNHYMVPLWNGEGLASPKYGNIAIDMLLEEMQRMGSKKGNLVAKIFGGANQFQYNHALLNVGERNIQIAETLLEKHRINISASSLGGTQGRKIVFNSLTGQVLMKFIVKQNVS